MTAFQNRPTKTDRSRAVRNVYIEFRGKRYRVAFYPSEPPKAMIVAVQIGSAHDQARPLRGATERVLMVEGARAKAVIPFAASEFRKIAADAAQRSKEQPK